jgi:hypothetical protein
MSISALYGRIKKGFLQNDDVGVFARLLINSASYKFARLLIKGFLQNDNIGVFARPGPGARARLHQPELLAQRRDLLLPLRPTRPRARLRFDPTRPRARLRFDPTCPRARLRFDPRARRAGPQRGRGGPRQAGGDMRHGGVWGLVNSHRRPRGGAVAAADTNTACQDCRPPTERLMGGGGAVGGNETCPVSTGGGTRLVRLVRGRGGGGAPPPRRCGGPPDAAPSRARGAPSPAPAATRLRAHPRGPALGSMHAGPPQKARARLRVDACGPASEMRAGPPQKRRAQARLELEAALLCALSCLVCLRLPKGDMIVDGGGT